MKSILNKSKEKDRLSVVQEIHQKMLSGGERCLNDAKLILANTSVKNIELYEKMSKLGFGNVEEISKNKTELESKRLAFEHARLIEDYSVRYPNHKFITTEEMEKICKEYNLLLGADQHFTGSMPERSMEKIVNFKLRPEDEIYYKGTAHVIEAKVQNSKAIIKWAEIDKATYMKETNNGQTLIQNGRRTHYISNKDYFTIAAPESMFRMEGMVKDGVNLKQVIEVDDPACLKTVRCGFLIVAVWGEEIAIKAMQNEKFN